MSKINKILTEWKEGDLHSLKWLKERGVGQRLAYKYADELNSLEKVGPGVYKRVAEPINWMGVVRLFQQELNFNIHISSRSALEFEGHSHYIPIRRQKIYLRSYGNNKKLPKWFYSLDIDVEFRYKKSKMFPEDLKFLNKEFDKFQLTLAPRELAILEFIDDSSLSYSLETIENYMNSLLTLRSDVIQNYLELCRSIKVKRVFLYVAEKLNMPWFSKLNLSKINLGSGKRVIVENGEFNKKYNITVDRTHEESPF
jgi:hypothetical protein